MEEAQLREIVACLADAGEHDIYVVNYRGPDRDYRGRAIAFVFDGRAKDTASRGGLRHDDTPGELVGGTSERAQQLPTPVVVRVNQP